MIRTQIQLTEEQYARLKELSLRNRKPLAELIRMAIERMLLIEEPDQTARFRQAAAVIGKYRTQAEDISVNHDRYLSDAYHA